VQAWQAKIIIASQPSIIGQPDIALFFLSSNDTAIFQTCLIFS
jgi:hypothetical protein